MIGSIHHLAFILLGFKLILAQTNNDSSFDISSIVVVRPRSMSVDFWTAERMKAAVEPKISLPPNGTTSGRSSSISSGPQVTISGAIPDATNATGRILNSQRRHLATSGRVFWSCTSGSLSSCSAGVIPSASGDVIVTAGHCVFDTTTLRWLIGCNWIFVPGYSNGNAPYGRWPARRVAAWNAWTRTNPDYNYDVAFVALSTISGRHISQITGSQSLGFNQPRGQLSYSFGYPINLSNGQYLQSCSGIPVPSRYTANGYKGQGLTNCRMTGGSSGGPWLQKFNTVTGVGITYSVNSFTYSLAPNTINGPVFDSNVQAVWNYITAL